MVLPRRSAQNETKSSYAFSAVRTDRCSNSNEGVGLAPQGYPPPSQARKEPGPVWRRWALPLLALIQIIAIAAVVSAAPKNDHKARCKGSPTCSKPAHSPSPSPTSVPTHSPSPSPSPTSVPTRSPSPSPSASDPTQLPPPPSPPALEPLAFGSTSYWNTALPADVPLDPDSTAMIAWLQGDNVGNYIRLGGTGSNGLWGNPVYWSRDGDPTYHVINTCRFAQPPEFAQIRIPKGAASDATSDSAMTVYDTQKGLVYGLWKASYDAALDRWSACGGAVYYLNSNGLDHEAAGSDEPRNNGHRGLPPSTYAVLFDDIRHGAINHVLKISVNHTGCAFVFPMVGDECGTTAALAPPEGTRVRIKPSVDLSRLGLSPAAMVIARALQRYGAVIGDQSGGPATLKVENTTAEGRGQLWTGILNADSLHAIPLDAFEVIRPGWRP